MNTPQVYVAGAYTAGTTAQVRENIADALRAGLQLARLGFFPIVPHAMGSHRTSWEDAMARCRVTISAMDPARDMLVLLPGWENSRGAGQERDLAIFLGVPVRTLAEVVR